MPTTLNFENYEHLARKRAGAKLGWLIHASVYTVVNLFLVLIAASTGKAWAIFPLLGWGLGLAIHAAVAWLAGGGSALHARLLTRERARLAAQRDPW
jgi:2TM domain